MARVVIAAAAFAAVALSLPLPGLGGSLAVERVVDGDTIVVTGGARVRLVQIDTPELGSGECYSRRAAKDLRRLIPAGTPIALHRDPRLDRRDRYGRLLRYVFRGRTNINLALVARGDATVWFYEGARGRYAGTLLWAAARARRLHRGLWGACRAVWNPYGPATTSARTSRPLAGRRCDPSYPGVCIPPPPPDLDCADVRYRNFRVLAPDPHHFDGDHNGRGCERVR
jgi:micrococcal nuclease